MCGSQYNHDLATPGKPGLKKRLLTLFSKSVKAEDMYGKQWVQISHQARPYALLDEHTCSTMDIPTCSTMQGSTTYWYHAK